ncbi:MAG: hypothetical protein HMLIMOIP_002305 [Candidatus Nitrosomirales archaeon]|jgi:hypothetical protein
MLSLTSVLFSGFLTPAFAVQLDTLLMPAKNTGEAFYKNVDIVYIEYPNGGKVKSELENVNDQISFTADKSTPGVQELIDKINQKLVKERKSPAIIEDLKIDYRATLEGEGDRAVLERLLKLNAKVTNFVINAGSAEEGTLIDLNWRGFKLDEPAVIKTEEYGDVDINLASGYFYARQPEIMKILGNSDAVKVLNKPSIDFTEFTDLTLDKWHWSFDPTGSIKESENFGFTETGGAKVITFFALGEGSIREGIHRETITEVDVAVDGEQYKVRNTTPPSAASIQILGYATQSIQGSDEGAVVFENAPEGGTGKSYTGGFPITVLMVMGGMLGAIAGFVLWRANKK